jgi:hypothetical protein
MQQLIYNNSTFKVRHTGAENSLSTLLLSIVANYFNIGSSVSSTSFSDYIENKTKLVGRFILSMTKNSMYKLPTMSVSNVKNHNLRPEIGLYVPKKQEQECLLLPIK